MRQTHLRGEFQTISTNENLPSHCTMSKGYFMSGLTRCHFLEGHLYIYLAIHAVTQHYVHTSANYNEITRHWTFLKLSFCTIPICSLHGYTQTFTVLNIICSVKCLKKYSHVPLLVLCKSEKWDSFARYFDTVIPEQCFPHALSFWEVTIRLQNDMIWKPVSYHAINNHWYIACT